MNNYIALKIEDIYKHKNKFNEISIVGDFIFWKQSLKISGENKNAIFVRPIKQTKLRSQNLTGNSFYINSKFHGYGGKSYKCIQSSDYLYLVWIDQISGSIWAQKLQINKLKNKIYQFPYLIKNEDPRQISKPLDGNFDANFELMHKEILFGILEINNNDYLYSLNINHTKKDLNILKKFKNFAGSLSSNLNGNILSWIEWDSPYMPWENNNLYFANVANDGEIKTIKKLDKSIISNSDLISFFQPYWLSKNILVCSEDSSGWWNLIFFEINQLDNININKKICKKFYEYGLPQWVSGISLLSGCKENFFCVARYKDKCVLEYYKNLTFEMKIDLPFTNISDLYVSDNKLVFKASSNICEEQLIELEINDIYEFPIKKEMIKISDRISQADTFWFKGFKGRNTHAWIYKSKFMNSKKSPLLVKAHSGPTSYFNGALNPEVQFWTSRGWFVAEINYSGSSGFGKEYRERLNSNWGIADSEDCKALVWTLIKKELIDISKIVILGNSAGGFTALNALCGHTPFKAAICKYPVLDLNEMHFNTHRFEKNYLNSLVGNFNKNKEKYFERSPINKIDKISQPLLLFHGKKDRVIDYRISLAFHKKRLINQMNSEIHLYEEEGHGFRNINNKLNYLSVSELFLNKLFF